MIKGLVLTVVLGVLFTSLQAYEYVHAAFGFKDGIYPSTFYMATGFHGFHVIIGTTFLTVTLIRAVKGHFKPDHHFGFEAAAWYWHFVDVVRSEEHTSELQSLMRISYAVFGLKKNTTTAPNTKQAYCILYYKH